MSDIAIKIEGLGKRYRYGAAQSVSSNLRADLMDWARGVFRRGDRSRKPEAGSLQSSVSSLQSSQSASVSSQPSSVSKSAPESSGISLPASVSGHAPHPTLHEVHEDRIAHDPSYFWALKDINLEVRPGEVVGIIGRNGAGKSTLLKILSRITPPTTGKITYNGRMASLLEVGTGFHRELTGRENIFLNGSILGMKRSEIAKKFDEIVAFAEVEKFIDTPVKFYSSGMYVRLAFAVAAHLDTEILLVDEVLAVGDAEFQKKCLGKMGEVAKQGRTVLFVSHSMATIEALCTRVVLLARGQTETDGRPEHVIAQYLCAFGSANVSRRDLQLHAGRAAKSQRLMKTVFLTSDSGQEISAIRIGASLSVHVDFVTTSKPLSPVLGIVVRDVLGIALFTVNNKFIGGYCFPDGITQGTIVCHLPTVPLVMGTYFIDLYFGDPHQDFDVIEQAISVDVIAADYFGTGKLPTPGYGSLLTTASWTLDNPSTPRTVATVSLL